MQTGPDAYIRLEGLLEPADFPTPGRPGLYAPMFATAPGGAWLAGDDLRLDRIERDEWGSLVPAPDRPQPALPWGPPEEDRFRRAFTGLRELIHRGILLKGVPASRICVSIDPAETETLLSHLLRRVPLLPPTLMAYGLCRRDSATGTLAEFTIGATPEVLFEIHGPRRLTTMAVAGTRWASVGPDALQSSAKDRDEHEFVVYDLLNRLAAWGDASVSGTIVRPFGALEHLVTEIDLEARTDLDFESVARALHPTPALGVYPRIDAGRTWLATIDPAGERRRFGAPFGISQPGEPSRCVVAIRSVQYLGGVLNIWAGCGVVAQSRYEEEWQEVLDKIQTVRALWGL